MNDLRYALRVLVKNPGFLITAVLTLAIGIGANTAIFSAINTALLQPLPYPDAERLVLVREQMGKYRGNVTVPDFLDWRRDQTPFASMAGYGQVFVSLSDGGGVERWPGRRVSADYFRVLGVQPALGRDFTSADEPLGADKVVILSDGLWRTRFNADPAIVGRTLVLNGISHTVIGVSSPVTETFSDPVGFYMPLALTPPEIASPGNHWMTATARLKPGLTIAQAETQLAPLADAAKKARPGSNSETSITLQPMQDAIVGSLRQPLWLLLAIVGAVLLIACANVANLVLIRSVARQREVAIRTALGASRWQIVRQLLIENLALAAIGGAVGLVVARWLQALLPRLLPDSVLRFAHPSLDWRVLGFALVLTLIVGLLSGLAPALQVSRRPPQDTLQDASRGSVGPRRHRLGASLVIAEIALALMLVVGAGLLVRSFVRMLAVDPGLKPDGVVVMTVALPEIRYPSPEHAIRFFDQVLEGAQHLPGVQSAAVSNSLPFRESPFGMGAFIEGRPRPARLGQTPFFLYRPVSPDYFATLGIPVLKGRAFTPDDREGRPRVCLINQTAAQRYFPNGDAIGQRLSPDDGSQTPAEIVGIVGDVKQNGLGADTRTELLVAVAQTPPFVWRANARTLTLIVRTQPAIGDAASIVPSLRDMVRRLDGTVPTYQVATMPQIVADSMATPQRYMFVVLAFGTIALALAALGIYGVMTFLVRQRTHEIGVRIALGAVRGDVLRLVFGRVMLLTVSGLAIGLALAFALARWLGTFLFEIKPTDAITYLLGGVVLFIVALLAAYLPAYRATRIDPVTALRN